jgi:long-chain acyl-CoA synthetase
MIMNQRTKINILHAHEMKEISATDYMVRYNNIHELLDLRLSSQAEYEYISFFDETGKKVSLSYREFILSAYRLANFLLSRGIKKEDRVATFSHNHIDTVILYFACWTIAAVVVPINVNEEPERVNYILKNSGSIFAFTRNRYLDKIKNASEDLEVEIIDFDNFDVEDQPSELTTSILNGTGLNNDKETEAMIVYTSGTTGNPKGVVLTQYNLMVDAYAIADWHGLKKNDVMMCVLPIHHVNGTVVTIMTTMFYGGKLVLNQKFQTENFFKRLTDEKVKVVSVVPTLLQYLLHSDQNIKDYDLSSFSHIICGAGPLTCELARNFEERFGLRIVHGYGLSETTCYSCFIPVDLSKEEQFRWQNEFGFPSIGIPILCNEMEIHNEKGESLYDDEKGEIVIRGHNVMKYYFNNDEVNEKTFEFGWFRSGDEGFFKYDDKGNKYFFITGRLKELIIRGAVNISPLEIDEVINSIDCVKSGIAVGFDNDWYGEEIGALVMLNDDIEGEKEKENYKIEIISYCRKKLPFFKSPKVIIFSDSIPVTSTGKYQRNKVKHLFEEYKTVQFKNES